MKETLYERATKGKRGKYVAVFLGFLEAFFCCGVLYGFPSFVVILNVTKPPFLLGEPHIFHKRARER